VWDIPNGLKFTAFYFGGLSGCASPLLYSWINSTLRYSTAERGLIISSMMTFGYCTYIWVSLGADPSNRSLSRNLDWRENTADNPRL
jgi:hypothetical protein